MIKFMMRRFVAPSVIRAIQGLQAIDVIAAADRRGTIAGATSDDGQQATADNKRRRTTSDGRVRRRIRTDVASRVL
jgi:hypothetical protein